MKKETVEDLWLTAFQEQPDVMNDLIKRYLVSHGGVWELDLSEGLPVVIYRQWLWGGGDEDQIEFSKEVSLLRVFEFEEPSKDDAAKMVDVLESIAADIRANFDITK